MKGCETNMINLRQILQRLREKQSIRSISSETKTHRTIIRKMVDLAVQKKWLDPHVSMPSDAELMRAWSGDKANREHVLDFYKEKIQEWKEADCSAIVIQRLLKNNVLDGVDVDVQVVRRYLNKHRPKNIKPIMVRTTIPGEDADVDFGDIGIFEDEDGVHKKMYILSIRLRHSRRAYREIISDQKSITFNKGHIHAFEFFGGVMKKIHPDCTKCAVIKASIENDGLNRAYQSLAEHYGFIISPCRPYTPEHKGGVEKDMDYVKGDFIVYFRAEQKEKGILVPKIKDLRVTFEKWQREVDDVHVIHGVDRTPKELFFSEEKPCLKPLPDKRWDIHIWAQCTVRADWRVLWECGYYSVPYTLIGEKVDVCITSTFVRIFHNHIEVTLHDRCTKKWEYKRKPEHAPPFREAVLQCTREGVLDLARGIGPCTVQYAEKILSVPSIDKLSPIRNMLRLAEKHTKERLEKACERGLQFQFTSYREIKNILERKLEENTLDEPSENQEKKTKSSPQKKYKYSRDSQEYRRQETWDEQIERSHPVSKYGNGALGAYHGKMADDLIDELIKEEEKAVAEGREGPLHGKIPHITEAWYKYNNIPMLEKHQSQESEASLSST